MLDVNDVIDLGFRRPVNPSHVGSLQRATEENTEFEKIPLGTHKEVAGLAREHNRLVRGVNPLIAEGNGRLAQPFPSIPQIVGEFPRQSRFSGRPTVVLFSILDPLLAVMAFPTGHTSELYWRLSRNWHCSVCSPHMHTYRQDLSTPCFRSAVAKC